MGHKSMDLQPLKSILKNTSLCRKNQFCIF